MHFYSYNLFNEKYNPNFFKLPKISQRLHDTAKRYSMDNNAKCMAVELSPPPQEGGRFRLNAKISVGDIEDSMWLAEVTLTPVPHNCGAIHLSNLQKNSYCSSKVGTLMFENALKFIEHAGYSFVICNTADADQNEFGVKVLIDRYGFIPIGHQYINKRSNNINLWLYKFIGSPTVFDSSEFFEEEDPAKALASAERDFQSQWEERNNYYDENEE